LASATSKHQPVVDGECTKCHSPHQAVLDGLLLAKGPDLCLSCHKTLKASMDGGRVHSPAARDCLRCHKPHASAEARLVAQPVRTLCAECHDLGGAAFGTAHLQIDPARIRCERCHDAHASKDPKLFKANAHAPFAAKGCQDCHLPPRATK
jgi:predicted CXXCH cytochrome family protein